MTVTYSQEAATSSFACFLKLLVRWRGSVYKLVWKEFLIFIGLYYFLSLIYRFALTEEYKRVFEYIAAFCEKHNNLIPVAFVLGFYVSLVIGRWWEQIGKIPWPTRMAFFVTANLHGHDERGRLMRRTIMRYMMLSYVITMNSISPVVKKRFPKFDHMTEAGLMNENEQRVLENIKTDLNKYIVPLAWATAIISRARKENRITNDVAEQVLLEEMNNFRGGLGSMFLYDWINLPLVYTQVVTLATYMFFLSCLMGRQFIVGLDGDDIDLYVPVFTFLQFLFYMGWLKVAEALINPFGEDDDDFELNRTIDDNIKSVYMLVDEMHQEHPELIKDQYWDQQDVELPYTVATADLKEQKPFIGSAMNISIPEGDLTFVAPTLSNSDIAVDLVAGAAQHSPQVMGRSTSITSERPILGGGGLLHRLRRSLSRQESYLPRSMPRQDSMRDIPLPNENDTPDLKKKEFDPSLIMQKVPDASFLHTPQDGVFEMSEIDASSPPRVISPDESFEHFPDAAGDAASSLRSAGTGGYRPKNPAELPLILTVTTEEKEDEEDKEETTSLIAK